MKTFAKYLAALLFVPITLCLVGCGGGPAAPAGTPAKATDSKKGHGHDHPAHGEGPHGGTVADWGGGKFHVEFTVDHDKQEATVYILGDDEKTAKPIPATSKLTLSIKQLPIQVELTPAPQAGDAEGTSSVFVGKHENLGIVQEYAGMITGEVDGTPYTGDFKEEPGHEKK